MFFLNLPSHVFTWDLNPGRGYQFTTKVLGMDEELGSN